MGETVSLKLPWLDI